MDPECGGMPTVADRGQDSPEDFDTASGPAETGGGSVDVVFGNAQLSSYLSERNLQLYDTDSKSMLALQDEPAPNASSGSAGFLGFFGIARKRESAGPRVGARETQLSVSDYSVQPVSNAVDGCATGDMTVVQPLVSKNEAVSSELDPECGGMSNVADRGQDGQDSHEDYDTASGPAEAGSVDVIFGNAQLSSYLSERNLQLYDTDNRSMLALQDEPAPNASSGSAGFLGFFGKTRKRESAGPRVGARETQLSVSDFSVNMQQGSNTPEQAHWASEAISCAESNAADGCATSDMTMMQPLVLKNGAAVSELAADDRAHVENEPTAGGTCGWLETANGAEERRGTVGILSPAISLSPPEGERGLEQSRAPAKPQSRGLRARLQKKKKHLEVPGTGKLIVDDYLLAKSKSSLPAAFRTILTLKSTSRRKDLQPEDLHSRHSASRPASRLGEQVQFDGPSDDQLDRVVKEKMNVEGLTHERAMIAARVERIVRRQGGEDNAMFYILGHCPTEGELITFLNHLVTYGADVNAVDSRGRSALHVAIQRDFRHVAKALLTHESSPEKLDGDGRLAVEYALENLYAMGKYSTETKGDDMASLIILHMDRRRVRSLFESSEDDDFTWKKPLFNFYDLLADMHKTPKTAEAVLDSFVAPTQVPDRYDFHFTILESDCNGVSPFQSKFNLGCKTSFHRVLDMPGLRDHSIIRTLIFHKWNNFGERSTLKNVLFYFVFVFLTSFAFISAGDQRAKGFRRFDVNDTDNSTVTVVQRGDPREYPDTLSYFRAICEVLVMLGNVLSLYSEVREMIATGFRDYFQKAYNFVQLSNIILLVVMVPLRVVDHDWQWYTAAITYMLVCMRTLHVISVTKVVGIYLQILIEIVKKDMSKFAIIFTIFWLMFSGSTYLVLVGTPDDAGTSTGTQLDIIAATNSYPNILLTGLRILAEAESVVGGYEEQFHWLAVVIMMLFLFILLIVLLNILIAQLSDTYQEVKRNAQRTLERNWAGALRTLEQSDELKLLRFKSFVDYVSLDHPESFLIDWKKPQDLTERRAEGRRQRFIEQQLAKQEQQLVAIRSQLRKSLGMLKDEASTQVQMQDMMQDMIHQQLPGVMETIVHRNTEHVIQSMSGSTARSAREIEEHVHQRVVQEVMTMLENATDEVVARVGGMIPSFEPPI